MFLNIHKKVGATFGRSDFLLYLCTRSLEGADPEQVWVAMLNCHPLPLSF